MDDIRVEFQSLLGTQWSLMNVCSFLFFVEEPQTDPNASAQTGDIVVNIDDPGIGEDAPEELAQAQVHSRPSQIKHLMNEQQYPVIRGICFILFLLIIFQKTNCSACCSYKLCH